MKITISNMYCTKCGNKGIDIPRRNGQQREPGHLKKIFCLYCKKETNHVEIKPYGKYRYEDFLLEFKGGNFDEEGNRILPYGIFKKTLDEKNQLAQLKEDIAKMVLEGEMKNE